MRTIHLATFGAALALSGCATVARIDTELSSGAYEYPALELGAYRAYQGAFADQPFADGAISILATEHGSLRTYALTPCHDATRICGGSEHGPVAQTVETDDYTIVSGLYGATFWLSPGGDGALVRGGQTVPLAWE